MALLLLSVLCSYGHWKEDNSLSTPCHQSFGCWQELQRHKKNMEFFHASKLFKNQGWVKYASLRIIYQQFLLSPSISHKISLSLCIVLQQDICWCQVTVFCHQKCPHPGVYYSWMHICISIVDSDLPVHWRLSLTLKDRQFRIELEPLSGFFCLVPCFFWEWYFSHVK